MLNFILLLEFGCNRQDQSIPANETSSNILPENKIILVTAAEKGELMYELIFPVYREAFKRIGYEFELTSQPAERALVDVNSGRYHGDAARIYQLSQTGEYPNLIRLNESICRITISSFSVRSDIQINNWESLKNKDYIVAIRLGIKYFEMMLARYVDEIYIYKITDMKNIPILL